MKKILGAALWGFLFLVPALQGWSQEEENAQPGRYQLFQGKYVHYEVDSGDSAFNEGMFLLDTVTGEVQSYYSQTKDGRTTKSWVPAIYDES